MPRIAIIAAMEREIAPLVRRWRSETCEHDRRQYRVFQGAGSVLICGGIGSEAARRATEAVIQQANPELVLSVGFAGALDRALGVGDIIEPCTVVNSRDGARTQSECGKGTLVSSPTVADKEEKRRLRETYGASAVDMEASAVAEGARARGVRFAALKVISDGADFSPPAFDGFIAEDGTFRTLKFAAHAALRPWMWNRTIALARNSSKASKALCAAISKYLAREQPWDESLAAQMNQKIVER